MQSDKILSKVLAICDDSNQGGEIFLIAHELFIRLTAQGERPYPEFERWHPFAFTYLCLCSMDKEISEGIIVHHVIKGIDSCPIFTGSIKQLCDLGIDKLSQLNSVDELNTVLSPYRKTLSQNKLLSSSYIKHVDTYMNSPIFDETDMLNWSSFKYSFLRPLDSFLEPSS